MSGGREGGREGGGGRDEVSESEGGGGREGGKEGEGGRDGRKEIGASWPGKVIAGTTTMLVGTLYRGVCCK